MNTRKIIEGLKARMFDPSYISALKTAYGDQVEAGYFEIEEKEVMVSSEEISLLDPEIALPLYSLRIKSVKKVDEMGIAEEGLRFNAP